LNDIAGKLFVFFFFSKQVNRLYFLIFKFTSNEKELVSLVIDAFAESGVLVADQELSLLVVAIVEQQDLRASVLIDYFDLDSRLKFLGKCGKVFRVWKI
jgi:hypothetical protein